MTARVYLGEHRSTRRGKAAGALATAKQLVNVDEVVSEARTRRMCGVVGRSKTRRRRGSWRRISRFRALELQSFWTCFVRMKHFDVY